VTYTSKITDPEDPKLTRETFLKPDLYIPIRLIKKVIVVDSTQEISIHISKCQY